MWFRLKLALIVLFAAALALGVWTFWFALSPLELASPSVEFTIGQGSTLRAVTRQMIAAGLPLEEQRFILLARLQGANAQVKAGTYQAANGITPLLLLRKITRGEYALAEILFVEGWTFRQVRVAMKSHPGLKDDTESLSDEEIMAKLGAPGKSPEGMFFPDKYVFAKGSSDLAVLARAYRAMQQRLEAAWAKRAADLPLTGPYEALVLASIVEKETGRPEDRAMIAGVFINRLKKGMRLQTDPTVIYGLGESFDGNLRKRDLETDTPFNTYTRAGLPPHPIAMPGLAAIEAVAHPAQTDALYFVSRGDGSSEFSRTLIDHNRAVTKYQLPGRRGQAKQ